MIAAWVIKIDKAVFYTKNYDEHLYTYHYTSMFYVLFEVWG